MTDRYGIAVGLPLATAILLKKQIQYRYSHGIGKKVICYIILAEYIFILNEHFIISQVNKSAAIVSSVRIRLISIMKI